MLTSSVLMSVVVTVVVVVMGVAGQRVLRRGDPNEDIPDCNFLNIYQRSHSICPERAVCADEWNSVRDWYNGTRCRDHRVVFNCLCPGNYRCPIDNPAHRLYASKKQSQYLCEPACSLEACSTYVRSARDMVTIARRYRYYRVNCRCEGHHYPMRIRRNRGRRGMTRATTYLRFWMNNRNNTVLTQYKCSSILRGDDPCSRSN